MLSAAACLVSSDLGRRGGGGTGWGAKAEDGMGGETTVAVLAVIIIFGGGTACTLAFIHMLGGIFSRNKKSDLQELTAEVKRLTQEVRELKQQNADVILQLDSGLDQVQRRVGRLEGSESRALPLERR